MRKYTLFSVFLLGLSSAYSSSNYAPCKDDEEDKTFIASALAKAFVPEKTDAVTITYEDLHTAGRALLRHAHLEGDEPSAGFAEAQKNHLNKTIAKHLMRHSSLQELHLTFEMGPKHLAAYQKALAVQMHDAAGGSRLRVLSLDITSFVGLTRSEAFICAFLHAPALEEVNIHNIQMDEDEGALVGLLSLLHYNPRVEKLGLFEVPASLGSISKLRLTSKVFSMLGLKQYDTLTLDTLGVEGVESDFIAYVRGLTRPLTLRVKGDVYVNYAYVGSLRSALRSYGHRYQTSSGKVFSFCQILNAHREV